MVVSAKRRAGTSPYINTQKNEHYQIQTHARTQTIIQAGILALCEALSSPIHAKDPLLEDKIPSGLGGGGEGGAASEAEPCWCVASVAHSRRRIHVATVVVTVLVVSCRSNTIGIVDAAPEFIPRN